MRKKLSFVLGALLVCALVIGMIKTSPVDAASKVKLNAKKKTIYIGEKFQLELEGAKGEVKWSTSKKKVATVDAGVVTAVKNGKTTITAKALSTNKAYKCKITVKKNAISTPPSTLSRPRLSPAVMNTHFGKSFFIRLAHASCPPIKATLTSSISSAISSTVFSSSRSSGLSRL